MLEIKHLTKAYERVILKDVCLSFKEKGLYVITGQSGCGKSTLLNMIGGLDSNYQGIIEMDGRDIQTIPCYIQKYVGFIFQQFHLIEEMSVKENETLISYFKRIFSAKKEILLSQLKLKNLQSYKTKLLSGGQKQRIAIYRGFIANHPVVLCDEPTGALDVKNSEEVFKTLKELAKEKLVIVISHDEKLASKYHDYLYEIKNQQIHLVHQNKIKETITAKEKTTKKSFFQFLLKDFKLCWKSHFIVIQVLFIALLSIMLTLSLTNSTNKQIQAQLEKIIPSTTIMLKKKNNEMLTQKDLQNIHHKEITYRFLQNDDVEFLGISPLKKYQTNKTLYISDYIQKPKYKIQGKEIGNDQEIILARSTYEQLIYLTKQKSLMNQEVYLFFDYQNEVKSYPVKIVGIEEKETVMETLYLKEFAFNHYLQELYQLEQGHTAFLQVKNKKAMKILKEKYPIYQFKLANSSLSSTIDKKFKQIEIIFLGFSSLSIITACFLLGFVLYLMVIKRKKYFAILQTLGASLKQVCFIVLFQGLIISGVAFFEAFLVLNQLFVLANTLIKESISNLMDNFFIVSYEMMGVMFIVVLIFTLLCSMVPIKKVKEIEIIEALKG